MDRLIEGIIYNLKQSKAGTSSPLSDITRLYFGDPKIIPERLFPVICVMPMSTEYESFGTEYDKKRSSVQIRLIYNQKNFFNNNIETAKTITNAVWSGGYVTFTSASHGY